MIYLLYHSFSNSPDRYHITPQVFKKHVKEIAKRPGITITIDDGVPSVYNIAFPIMETFGVSAIIFVDTEKIGGVRMSERQIREMSQCGYDIQSHSHTHTNHLNLDEDKIIYEGARSKEVLEKITGKKVDKYAFPHGMYNKNICEILKNVGYRDFFISDYGTKTKYIPNMYAIHERIEIYKEQEIDYFLLSSVMIRRKARVFLRNIKHFVLRP